MIEGGPSNFSRAQVPWAFDLAAAWAWRFIVIAAAAFGALWLLGIFAVVVLPLLIALLIAALLAPADRDPRPGSGCGRRLAVPVLVLGGLVAVVGCC